MTAAVSIKSTIPSKVPHFIQEDHPLFVAFVEAYYEYLDQENGPNKFIQNASSYISPKDSLDEFVSNFFEELKQIPRTVIADKRLLAEHIFELYQAKGTVKGLELLFRMMFNESIDVYFPKSDMLRVSDGKWARDVAFRVTVNQGDIYTLIGNRIIQREIDGTIFATAYVENVIGREFYNNKQYYDVVVNPNSITGNFLIDYPIVFGEDISLNIELSSRFSATKNRGSGYRIGDLVFTEDAYNLQASVDSILPGSIEDVLIIDGGTGHYVGEKFTITSSTGNFADIRVKTIGSSGKVTSVDIVSGGQGFEEFPLITLNNGIFAAISSTIGRVGFIRIADPGYGVTAPPDSSIDTNVVILPPTSQFESGEQIDLLSERLILESGYEFLLESGESLLMENQNNIQFNLRIDNASNFHATINGIIQKITFELENQSGNLLLEDGFNLVLEGSTDNIQSRTIVGQESGAKTRILYSNPCEIDSSLSATYDTRNRYISEDGKISEFSKRIQDSRYYQEYSYVIRSGQSISVYRNALLSLMHPAGMAVFGAIDIQSKIKLIVNSISGFSNVVKRIIELFYTIQLELAESKLRIETEIRLPTNISRDVYWLDKYKFSFNPFNSLVAGNVKSTQHYLGNLSDISLNYTMQNSYFANLKFSDIYAYDYTTWLNSEYAYYVDADYVDADYVEDVFVDTPEELPLLINEYLGEHYQDQEYYNHLRTKIPFTWNSHITGPGNVTMTSEIGEPLISENSLYRIIA